MSKISLEDWIRQIFADEGMQPPSLHYNELSPFATLGDYLRSASGHRVNDSEWVDFGELRETFCTRMSHSKREKLLTEVYDRAALGENTLLANGPFLIYVRGAKLARDPRPISTRLTLNP